MSLLVACFMRIKISLSLLASEPRRSSITVAAGAALNFIFSRRYVICSLLSSLVTYDNVGGPGPLIVSGKF